MAEYLIGIYERADEGPEFPTDRGEHDLQSMATQAVSVQDAPSGREALTAWYDTLTTDQQRKVRQNRRVYVAMELGEVVAVEVAPKAPSVTTKGTWN